MEKSENQPERVFKLLYHTALDRYQPAECRWKYADSTEVYDALCKYILKNIKTDTEFSKIIYQYMITRGEISPRQLCLILFDQGVLDYDDATVNKLKNGSLSPRDFLMKRFTTLRLRLHSLHLNHVPVPVWWRMKNRGNSCHGKLSRIWQQQTCQWCGFGIFCISAAW